LYIAAFGLHFTNSGTVEVQTNATLDLGGVALDDGSILTGDGLTRLLYPVYANGTITVNGTVELYYGTIYGTHTWTGLGVFNWNGGFFSGPGTTAIATNFHFNIVSGGSLEDHVLDNHGTMNWNSSDALFGSGNALFSNHGLFIIQTDCQLAGSGTFDNTSAGTVRSPAMDIVINWSFTNSGTLDLPSGAINFNGGYFPTASSVQLVTLGGHAPGTNFGYVNLTDFNPDGTLVVALTNGFVPNAGSSFPLVNYTAHSGAFSATQLPPLPNGLLWRVNYDTNSLILAVIQGLAITNLTTLPDGNVALHLLGPPASAAVIQAAANLINPTFWTDLATNTPFSGHCSFTDFTATNSVQKYYRALIMP
jgi:hypothetical protein